MKNPARHRKQAKRLLSGLTLNWSDPNPLSGNPDIRNGKVSHTKPLLRLMANDVWRDFREWIVHNADQLWRVDITVVFVYPTGQVQLETRRAIARGRLWDIAEQCHPVIEDAMRHGNQEHTTETRFSVICLGDRSATDADFEDYTA